MSKDHLSAKDRENRRVTIIMHGALTKRLNALEEKDYPTIHTLNSSAYMAEVLHNQTKFINQYKEVYEMEEKRVSVFDKALCLAMVLVRNPIITTTLKGSKVPKRLTDLNEKFIADAMLLYIGHSNYHIKRTEIFGDFDLSVFDDGHKRELKSYIDLLVLEFKNINFDYNTCLALLIKIYARMIIYANGLSLDLENYVIKNMTVKERFDAPQLDIKQDNTYALYRKQFRNMK